MERAICDRGEGVLWDGFQRISLQAEHEQFGHSRLLTFFNQIMRANLGEIYFIVIQEQIC